MAGTFTTKPLSAADFAATDGDYLAEIDSRLLTISRPSDGRMIAWHGRDVVDGFKSACRSHGPARAIATYLRIAQYSAFNSGEWMPGSYASPATVSRIIAELMGQGA